MIYQIIVNRIVNGIRKECTDSIPQCYYIVGRFGFGKSFLLSQIAKQLKLNGFNTILQADCILTPIFDFNAFRNYIVQHSHGERCVVLLDNVDDWFAQWKESELYKLRAFLYNSNAPVLVGTGRTLPTQLTEYNKPFYDSFMLYNLGLIVKDEVLEHVNEMRDEICLPHLGNDDLLKIHEVLSGTIYSPLMCKLISAVPSFKLPIKDIFYTALLPMTPYYMSVIERLTPAQRKTWMALLATGAPMLFSDMRKASGLSGNALTPQILTFVKNRLLVCDKVSPKKTLYSVADPIMIAWYKYCMCKSGR